MIRQVNIIKLEDDLKRIAFLQSFQVFQTTAVVRMHLKLFSKIVRRASLIGFNFLNFQADSVQCI